MSLELEKLSKPKLEKLVHKLMAKRPPSVEEVGLCEAVNIPLLGLRYRSLRMTLEILIGEPISPDDASRLYMVAKGTLSPNTWGGWDHDLPYYLYKLFSRWAL